MGDINRITHVENVKLREDGRAVVIIDQSLLPGRTEYIQLDSPEKMYDAIFHLKVRGAPAIGICAAYAWLPLPAVRLRQEPSEAAAARELRMRCFWKT